MTTVIYNASAISFILNSHDLLVPFSAPKDQDM